MSDKKSLLDKKRSKQVKSSLKSQDTGTKSVVNDINNVPNTTMQQETLVSPDQTFDTYTNGLSGSSPNRDYGTNVSIQVVDDRVESCDKTDIKLYHRRWYILLLFSMVGFTQGALIDVYQVTAESAEAAFGWSDATTSLMQNWIYLTYVIGVGPFSWLIDAKGNCLNL